MVMSQSGSWAHAAPWGSQIPQTNPEDEMETFVVSTCSWDRTLARFDKSMQFDSNPFLWTAGDI